MAQRARQVDVEEERPDQHRRQKPGERGVARRGPGRRRGSWSPGAPAGAGRWRRRRCGSGRPGRSSPRAGPPPSRPCPTQTKVASCARSYPATRAGRADRGEQDVAAQEAEDRVGDHAGEGGLPVRGVTPEARPDYRAKCPKPSGNVCIRGRCHSGGDRAHAATLHPQPRRAGPGDSTGPRGAQRDNFQRGDTAVSERREPAPGPRRAGGDRVPR